MSRTLFGASAVAIMLTASTFSPAIAQSSPSAAANEATGPAISTLTCGDVTGLAEADASALIYYAAGYQDGLRGSEAQGAMDGDNAEAPSADQADAANSAAGGAGDAVAEAETPDAATTPSNNANGADAAGTVVGGLGLKAGTIIDACSRTPDALISEIIANNGGSSGEGDAAGAGDSGSVGGASAPDAIKTPK